MIPEFSLDICLFGYINRDVMADPTRSREEALAALDVAIAGGLIKGNDLLERVDRMKGATGI